MKNKIRNFHIKRSHQYHFYSSSFYILGLVLYLSMSFVKAILTYLQVYNQLNRTALDSTEVVLASLSVVSFLLALIFNFLAMKHEGKQMKFSISKSFVLTGYIASSLVLLTSSVFLFYNETQVVALLDVIGYGIAIGMWILAFFVNIFIGKKYPHNKQH